MSSVNKVMLLGNLGQDPEVRTTQSGQMVATLSIATSKTGTARDGQRQEKTEWHRVVCWGKTAEIAERYLRKGRSVHIEGEISYRSWEDDSGTKRYMTEIVCNQLTLIGSGPRGDSEDGAPAASAPARGGQSARAPATGQGYGQTSRQSAQPPQHQQGWNDADIPF